jgi:mannose-6-phosphate isomerase-like protein (cupin superfamily)
MTERIIRYAGQDVAVLAGVQDPFAMVRMEVPAGFGGPPPHTHHDFDEAIYVLDGDLFVLDGEEERVVTAGELAISPRGRRHSFRNAAGVAVPILGIWTPRRRCASWRRSARCCRPPGRPTARRSPRCIAATTA